jgi:uncharacterized protein (TIGR02147 family)
MLNIFDFLDYRQYLRAIFEEKKQQLPSFSHRSLAHKLSLKAPGHILFIIQGKRRLTADVAHRLAAYLKLAKKEHDFLLSLVQYAEAKSAAEKQWAFEELLSIRQRAASKVTPASYRFYEKWYYSAIRASLDVEPFSGDFAALARSLRPPITVSEAKRAVETLLDLHIVERDENGRYRPAQALISTGDTWQSAIIQNVQRQFLDLAKDSFDLFPKEDLDLSNLTVTVSPETYDLIRKKIRELRGQIMNMACAEQNPDRVLQVNMQLFPLYKKHGGVAS